MSLNALKSIDAPACLLSGSLVCKRRLATVHRIAQRSAMMRIAHGKPILGAAKRMIMGKITPPRPPAVQAMPVA